MLISDDNTLSKIITTLLEAIEKMSCENLTAKGRAYFIRLVANSGVWG
jgi:hypothetical protein